MCSFLSSRSCLISLSVMLIALTGARRMLEDTYRQLSCGAVQKLHMLIVFQKSEVPLLHIFIKAGAHKALRAVIFCEDTEVGPEVGLAHHTHSPAQICAPHCV